MSIAEGVFNRHVNIEIEPRISGRRSLGRRNSFIRNKMDDRIRCYIGGSNGTRMHGCRFFFFKAGRSSDGLTRTQVPMITVEGNL